MKYRDVMNGLEMIAQTVFSRNKGTKLVPREVVQVDEETSEIYTITVEDRVPILWDPYEQLEQIRREYEAFLYKIYEAGFINEISIPKGRRWKDVVVFDPDENRGRDGRINAVPLMSYLTTIETVVTHRGVRYGTTTTMTDLQEDIWRHLEWSLKENVRGLHAYMKEQLSDANSVGESASGSSEDSGTVRP